MKRETRIKLNNVITELSMFLERDFSSRFRSLTEKEDRQLFFLARILTQLKNVSCELKEDEKLLIHPVLQKMTEKK